MLNIVQAPGDGDGSDWWRQGREEDDNGGLGLGKNFSSQLPENAHCSLKWWIEEGGDGGRDGGGEGWGSADDDPPSLRA